MILCGLGSVCNMRKPEQLVFSECFEVSWLLGSIFCCFFACSLGPIVILFRTAVAEVVQTGWFWGLSDLDV